VTERDEHSSRPYCIHLDERNVSLVLSKDTSAVCQWHTPLDQQLAQEKRNQPKACCQALLLLLLLLLLALLDTWFV
jgi:hypothetical protein